MDRDLYFLSIIADAIGKADPKTTLRAAMVEIEALGQQPEYKRGFSQFQRFMVEVRRNLGRRFQKQEDIHLSVVRNLALQVSTGLLEGDEARAVLDLIGSQPQWLKELERLCTEISKSELPQRVPEIIIERNWEPIYSIPCEPLPVSREIGDVKPGYYTVTLDTGRVIWQDELTEQELIWISAFPGQALDLAADTGDAIRRTTREITLLNGDLIIWVFPEIESGRLEVKIGG